MSNENKADDEIYDKLYEIIQSAVRSEVQRTLAQQGNTGAAGTDSASGGRTSDSMTARADNGTADTTQRNVSQLSEEEIAAKIAAMAEYSDDGYDNAGSDNSGFEAVAEVPRGNISHAADAAHTANRAYTANTAHPDDMKSRLVAYYAAIHEKNQKRIKTGMICMFVIPVVFLILLFTMQSSKIVYLVLWIVSLFILCGYLIAVEYSDYSLQEKLEALGVDDHGVDGSLIGPDVLEKDIKAMKERMGL